MEEVHLSIKYWAEEDRPREKLLLKGKSVLSDVELIAILIASGNRDQTAVELAQHILNHYGNNLNALAKSTVNELKKFRGIGEAKAIAIVSALELGRRRKDSDDFKKVKIQSSRDAYNLVRGNLMDLNHEEFWLIMLKRNNVVIKKEMVSKGGVSGTFVDSKLIFKRALEETASSIILVHNHPSGNTDPSREDIRLTNKLKDAGKSLDITVLDHLIFTDESFYSFADENMM